MQMRPLARWLGSAALVVGLGGLPACVVHDTAPVNPGYGYGDGYGYGPQRFGPAAGDASGGVSVGEPTPYTVSGMPPEPLYEQISTSPGDGFVWIDGYWHWNGYEWVWVNGRWERDQAGYVYVEPNYDYVGDQYVYTPGYWSQPQRVPRGWHVRDHRDGRPAIVAPPVASGGYRPPVVGGGGIGRPTRPPVASPGAGPTWHPPGRPGPIGPPPGNGGRPQRPPLYNPGGGRVGYDPPPSGSAPGIETGGAGTPTAQPPVIYQPPPRGPIRRPPTTAPGPGPTWHPPAPSQPPIYVNPNPPHPGPSQPPPSTGGPIYVNPNPSQPPVWHPGPPVGGAPRPSAPPPPAPVHAPPPAPVHAPPPVPPPASSGHPARNPR